jgi:hypothetical protein
LLRASLNVKVVLVAACCLLLGTVGARLGSASAEALTLPAGDGVTSEEVNTDGDAVPRASTSAGAGTGGSRFSNHCQRRTWAFLCTRVAALVPCPHDLTPCVRWIADMRVCVCLRVQQERQERQDTRIVRLRPPPESRNWCLTATCTT